MKKLIALVGVGLLSGCVATGELMASQEDERAAMRSYHRAGLAVVIADELIQKAEEKSTGATVAAHANKLLMEHRKAEAYERLIHVIEKGKMNEEK